MADVAVSLAKAGCLKGRRDCQAGAEYLGPAGARPKKSKGHLGVIVSADSIEQDAGKLDQPALSRFDAVATRACAVSATKIELLSIPSYRPAALIGLRYDAGKHGERTRSTLWLDHTFECTQVNQGGNQVSPTSARPP